jgi:hypothetical protein
LPLLFLHLEGKLGLFRLQHGETADVGAIGCSNQMGEHVHIAEGGFNHLIS